jgi:endonuclease YncB( thermonuclease family)
MNSRRRHPVSVAQLLIVVGGVSAGVVAGLVLTEPDALAGLPDLPASTDNVSAHRIAFGFCQGREDDNCIIDGDSFNIHGQSVRLAGIDAPELGNPGCESERQLAERAEERLHELLNGGAVRLIRTGVRDRDRYGRLLRDAEVDGASVGEQLIAEGLAQPWRGQKADWC